MKEQLILILFALRARLMRLLLPKGSYAFPVSSVYPLSRKFGLDRGTPIDRYYIEKFLENNKKVITGDCLEIGDDRYIRKYGTKLKNIHILDVDEKNTKATIIGDLRNIPQIKDNEYDCLILTQVIGMIDDLPAVMKECHRILRPGGALLITTSALAACIDYDYSFWRFTVKSLEYLFARNFNKKDISVGSFGNALTAITYYVGGVQEDLDSSQLAYYDKQFPCLIYGKAIKS